MDIQRTCTQLNVPQRDQSPIRCAQQLLVGQANRKRDEQKQVLNTFAQKPLKPGSQGLRLSPGNIYTGCTGGNAWAQEQLKQIALLPPLKAATIAPASQPKSALRQRRRG